MKKMNFMVLLSAILFCGCSSKALKGTWTTTEMNVAGKVQTVSPSEITFSGDGKVNGNSGVNSFFGDVKTSKTSFAVGSNLASTKMMGAPEEQAFEDNFMQILIDADSYEVSGDKLIIKSSKTNSSLTFKRK